MFRMWALFINYAKLFRRFGLLVVVFKLQMSSESPSITRNTMLYSRFFNDSLCLVLSLVARYHDMKFILHFEKYIGAIERFNLELSHLLGVGRKHYR